MAADEEDCTKRVRLDSGALHVFGFNAFLWLALLKGGKEDVTMEKVKQKTRNGHSEKVGLVSAEEQLQDFSFQWQILSSEYLSITIDLQEFLLPICKKEIRWKLFF